MRELADGSQAAALNATQSRDVLAALERLHGFYQTSGSRISLLAAVSEFIEAAGKKLAGCTLDEAVTGYLRTVVSVKRKDIGEAVTEFLQSEELRAKAKAGQRAQLSTKYAYVRALRLRKFADTVWQIAFGIWWTCHFAGDRSVPWQEIVPPTF